MKPTGFCPYCRKENSWAEESLKFKLEPEEGEKFSVVSSYCKNCGYMMFAREDICNSGAF